MVVSVRLAKTEAIFGHGGQVVEQRLETMDGHAIVGPFGAGFALGARGPLRWRYHGGPPGPPAALSASSNSSGARAWRMCHST